jgi:hypothetical protein
LQPYPAELAKSVRAGMGVGSMLVLKYTLHAYREYYIPNLKPEYEALVKNTRFEEVYIFVLRHSVWRFGDVVARQLKLVPSNNGICK